MRTLLIVLAALAVAPLVAAQSANADGSAASSATLTFYDAGGHVISTAEGEADLSHATTIELVTTDGSRSTFEITAAAATAEQMTVNAGGSNRPLLDVIADLVIGADAAAEGEADADAGADDGASLDATARIDASGEAETSSTGGAVLEVDVDETTGLTTKTVTTPNGVMITLRSTADGSVEVTVHRPESPVRDDAATEAGADATVDVDADAGTEAGGNPDADHDAEAGADAGAGADADADADAEGSAKGKVDVKIGGSVDLDGRDDD